MKNKKFYIVLTVILITVIFCGCEKEETNIELGTESNTDVVSDAETSTEIYVHISGAVKNPGVYSVENGARLYQVVEKAGGLTKKAEKDLLNLAETVADGQKIHVMTKKEYKSQSVTNEENVSNDSPKVAMGSLVDINTASEQELTELPGIGPSKATAIIKYREENGKFSSIEDIKNVSGIGDATFSNIESMITVN